MKDFMKDFNWDTTNSSLKQNMSKQMGFKI